MGFKPIIPAKVGADFNTAVSSNFKDLYDHIVYEKYKAAEERKPSKTFAPSSFRCDRLSFFRIRGVDPDPNPEVNSGLSFTAVLGTACHQEIQSNLIANIGDQWVKVSDYLQAHPISHEYEISEETEFETKIKFSNPPVKFACDGIIKIGEVYYLLEIKTSEYQSFKKLAEPKPQHIDQITCYCSLLEIHNALVLYQERAYGDIKCYEVNVSDYQMQETFERMNRVLDYVDKNLAPPKLPSGDYWCTYCKYKQRCKQWG